MVQGHFCKSFNQKETSADFFENIISRVHGKYENHPLFRFKSSCHINEIRETVPLLWASWHLLHAEQSPGPEKSPAEAKEDDLNSLLYLTHILPQVSSYAESSKLQTQYLFFQIRYYSIFFKFSWLPFSAFCILSENFDLFETTGKKFLMFNLFSFAFWYLINYFYPFDDSNCLVLFP